MSIKDNRGDFRPWPVRVITDGEAGMFDDHVKQRGLSFQTMDAASELPNVPGLGPQGVGKEQIRLFALGAWHVYGRQSFHVSPLLVEALLDTSLKRVPSAAIRAPYRACWIEAPLDLGKDLAPRKGVYLLSAEKGKDPYYDLDLYNGIPEGTHILKASAIDESMASITNFTVYLTKPSFEESIVASMKYIADQRPAGTDWTGPLEIDEPLERLWSFIANFLLYLSCPDPDLQPVIPQGLDRTPKSTKARAVQDRIRRREGTVRALGFRLTRVVRGSADTSPETSASSGEGGPGVQSHLVRGHWKQQPHGPKRMERKWIWVAPYHRGAEGETRIERTYLTS